MGIKIKTIKPVTQYKTFSRGYVIFLLIMGIVTLMLSMVAFIGAADIAHGCFIDPSGKTSQDYLRVGCIAGLVGLGCLILPIKFIIEVKEDES